MAGYQTDGMVVLPAGLVGGERMAVDTQYPGGQSPQTGAITSGMAAAGGLVIGANAASGSTVTLGEDVSNTYLPLSATVAALTIELPAPSGVGVVQGVTVKSAVTALTVTSVGDVAITGAPTALSAGETVKFQYMGSELGWVLVG